MRFLKLAYGIRYVPAGRSVVYLNPNNWDDFGFKTQFAITFCDENGEQEYIGEVKIGYIDQPTGWTAEAIPDDFDNLGAKFFSLGQDVDYYENISKLPHDAGAKIMAALGDLVANDQATIAVQNEKVFHTSLLRNVSYSSIADQFKRTLGGGAAQTSYHFVYNVIQDADNAGISLRFDVLPEAKPSMNIHVLIGRNGIGKTTLLNGMISALVKNHQVTRGPGTFWDMDMPVPVQISNGYFTALVSVSFSAFDPFTPPLDIEDAGQHIKYSYIGLKKVFYDGITLKSEHKGIEQFGDDFVSSLANCFSLVAKKRRWIRAIKFLESDNNFAEMDLTRLAADGGLTRLREFKTTLFEKMSSGHAIVLLTITKLVERVDEKTLVLMDEPESHLHPPLLSAFTRALADLLTNRNGVAIIATHSPVVLQEVPKSCVWKLRRVRLTANAERPESETFGENVGVLTREVFQLEVTKSGFHDLLTKSVSEGKSFDQILAEYNGQIGFEGRAVLRALVASRDNIGV